MQQKVAGFVAVIAILFFQGGFAMAQMLTTDTSAPAVEEPAPAPGMPVGPSISSISVTDITDTSARIDVNSDEMVQGYVEYGTTEQYGMSTPLSSEFTTSPKFLLENLTPETLYHYRVVVMDSSGSAAITADETFTTLSTPEPEPEAPPPQEEATTTDSTGSTTPDSTSSPQVTASSSPQAATTTSSTTENTGVATATPPAAPLAVSNTETSSISTTTARITWETNKSSDSQVQYGTTNAYGTLSSVEVSATTHSVTLAGLTPNTKYYYRAISKTSSGETAYGSPQQFTTLTMQALPSPPVISNVSTSISTSSVTITWTTSKPATSDIQYGTTTSYGFTFGKDSALTASHSRTISNLPLSTLYHFRLVVADSSGNTALGKDRTFTTPANPSAPVSTPAPAATSTANAETLSNIAQQGARAAASAPRGGGGLPVAPSHPMLLRVTPLDGQVAFNWRKDRSPINGTINTIIIRKKGTDPVRSRIDGDVIYDGPSTTFTDTNVENGMEYHYALYSYGQYGRFTAAARFTVIPKAGEEQVELSASETSAAPTLQISLTRDLSIGKRGDDVWHLQVFLAAHGYYPEALATGYFGPLTKAAVIRYQTLSGIKPAAGYVGPITKDVLGQY